MLIPVKVGIVIVPVVEVVRLALLAAFPAVAFLYEQALMLAVFTAFALAFLVILFKLSHHLFQGHQHVLFAVEE